MMMVCSDGIALIVVMSFHFMRTSETEETDMMLPFTGGLEKILDGTKTMTTRLDAKGYYERRWRGGMRKLDPWWGGQWWPKSDKYKIGIVEWDKLVRKLGYEFTKDDAYRDGFDCKWDYKVTLANHHGISIEEVNKWTWTQILWTGDGWKEGPLEPPKEHPAWKLLPRKVA